MKTFICARCRLSVTDYPATSRVDNHTELCSKCGSDEAFDTVYWKAAGWTHKQIVEGLTAKLKGTKNA